MDKLYNQLLCGFDWGLFGTWFGAIGALLTGASLVYLACKQNKINKYISNYNIIRDYQEHFGKLQVVIYELIRLDMEELKNFLMNNNYLLMADDNYSQIFFKFRFLHEESKLFEAKSIKNLIDEIWGYIVLFQTQIINLSVADKSIMDNHDEERHYSIDYRQQLIEVQRRFEILQHKVVTVYVSEIERLRKT